MTSYKYQIETLDESRYDAWPLLEQHYEEICTHTDVIELDPDWDAYYTLEEAGMLRIYTAREEETNELVGYFVVIQSPAIHYKQDIFCSNDLIYVDKKLRKTKIGYNLIKFAEDDLRELGVALFVINMKAHQPFDTLLEKMGYDLSELVYAKCFKREGLK